jgi:E3 ubiquitin-protein ligase UBR1
VFLLLRESSIVLIGNGLSLIHGSVYVDQFGEVDVGLRRGRPLTLSAPLWSQLQQLFARQEITQLIVRRRNHYDPHVHLNGRNAF